jgi:hypothetical protein
MKSAYDLCSAKDFVEADDSFKILHYIHRKDCTSDFPPSHNSSTRGNSFKMTYPCADLLQEIVFHLLFYFIFANPLTRTWNSLPRNVVLAETVNSFYN